MNSDLKINGENKSISSRLLSHFNEIELIKYENKIIGIKPHDKIKEWEIFSDELNRMDETLLSIFNAEILLQKFKEVAKAQESAFSELLKMQKWLEAQENIEGAGQDFFNYLNTGYSAATELKITNWKDCNGLSVTREFVIEFVSLMNFRMAYAHKVLKRLEQIVNITNDGKYNKTNIDWLHVFEQLDIEKEIPVKAYITNTVKQKEAYFNSASYKLTLQYLRNFKKETLFLPSNRKVDYINAMGISPPKIGKSESSLFNQTVFDAQFNYYDFLSMYRKILVGEISENQSADSMKDDRENKKQLIFDTFIDKNVNYCQTLEDFKEKAEVEKITIDSKSYLKFLRVNKELYGNSAFYHIQFTSNNIGDEHLKIKQFCGEEIKKLLLTFKGENVESLTPQEKSNQLMGETKKVFISYSWDNEAHKQWVLDLGDKLSDYVHVFLDRYDLSVGKTMTKFMEKSVVDSDKVLLIMTPNYKVKADNRTGGVGYEYSMVTQELYAKADNDKFIPIRREGSYQESAPTFLSTLISHDMTDSLSFEKDFKELLRIIFDEPEIKRPPITQKPVFAPSKMDLALIDHEANLNSCGMSIFAKWAIEIDVNSLNDLSKIELFRKITDTRIVGSTILNSHTFILNNLFKVSHNPDIIFEIPLQTFTASNHFRSEKIKIDEKRIRYEFTEYSNHAFWLLHLSQPFVTLLYLVDILKSIHNNLGKTVDLTIRISFESNRRALFYRASAPFDVGFLFENYEIPNGKAQETIKLRSITPDSIFGMYEKLYSLFVSENQKSLKPYLSLNREHFNKATISFLK